MRKNNDRNWTYNQSLDCMLFFAQRVDELLFHHTIDTYRYPSLSLRGLAIEFCTVYYDSQQGIINNKNLPHIMAEFINRLDKDPLAKDILTPEYVNRLDKNYGSWEIKQQFENINHIGRKLSNRTYYNLTVIKLKELVAENKKKGEIDALAKIWVREVIDNGYSAYYVYKTLHECFFYNEVNSLDSLDTFFSMFDFESKQYDVYIGFQKDLSPIKSLFEKLIFSEGRLLVLKPDEVQAGIKTKRQKTILKFEAVNELDMFSAFEKAYEVALHVVDAYSFFRHDGSIIKTYSQVVCSDKSIITIRQKHLLKQRVPTLSQVDSEKNADKLLSALFSNYSNRSNLRRIIKIHNSALKSGNVNDSLLSLWSLAESLVDGGGYPGIKENGDDRTNKSSIVIEYIVPFLKSTYLCKLIETCISDIKHWDEVFFEEQISSIEFGDNDIEKMFAFLAFSSTQDNRDKLYSQTEQYPLLRYRVKDLYDKLHKSKNIKSCITEHEKRVRWHLQRIYRARNYIIHDGSVNDKMHNDLVINLHSYMDITLNKIIEMLMASPYDDDISSIITEHRIEVSIFDELIEGKETEEINEGNARKYLYYDYRK